MEKDAINDKPQEKSRKRCEGDAGEVQQGRRRQNVRVIVHKSVLRPPKINKSCVPAGSSDANSASLPVFSFLTNLYRYTSLPT